MMYGNRELLADWQNNIDTVALLTKHSTTRTSKKSRLNELLNTISSGKILGASEHKVNGRKLLSTHNSTTNAVPALLECLSAEKLPAFLKAFYPEILQRKDYRQACAIVESNIKQLPTKRSKCLGKQRIYLFQRAKQIYEEMIKSCSLIVGEPLTMQLLISLLEHHL